MDGRPMSGFNKAKVDAEFFAGTGIKSNFLCNRGYGDTFKIMPRSPRPANAGDARADPGFRERSPSRRAR